MRNFAQAMKLGLGRKKIFERDIGKLTDQNMFLKRSRDQVEEIIFQHRL